MVHPETFLVRRCEPFIDDRIIFEKRLLITVMAQTQMVITNQVPAPGLHRLIVQPYHILCRSRQKEDVKAMTAVRPPKF